jgi:hypothetical protein
MGMNTFYQIGLAKRGEIVLLRKLSRSDGAKS